MEARINLIRVMFNKINSKKHLLNVREVKHFERIKRQMELGKELNRLQFNQLSMMNESI
jgi:hypothetical protein